MSGRALAAGGRPRFHPGVALGVLIVTAVAVIALARWSAAPVPAVVQEPVAHQRLLQFSDLPDGAVGVTDAGSGKEVARFEGEQGFLRGTLRAVARERRMRGLGAEQPLELIAYRDGRLSLHDPATGTRIALESFGTTNASVFARLLDPQ